MIGLDMWNYDKYWENQIIFTIVFSSLVFIYVSQKYYKQKRVNKIVGKVGEGVKIMFDKKIKDLKQK